MKQGFISVPFKIETDSGLSRAHGVAKFSAAGIVLEFENKFLGLMKTGLKEVRIPLAEILDVKIKSGGFFRTKLERLFSPEIEIRLNNFATISEFPHKEGRIVLDVPRQDRDLAKAAVENLQRILSGKLQEELPPTSMRQLFGDEAETKELKE